MWGFLLLYFFLQTGKLKHREIKSFPRSESTSLVAQTVKNLPATQETLVQSLGWEDPLEKGMAGYPLQYSYLRNPMDRRAWLYTALLSNMTKWLMHTRAQNRGQDQIIWPRTVFQTLHHPSSQTLIHLGPCQALAPNPQCLALSRLPGSSSSSLGTVFSCYLPLTTGSLTLPYTKEAATSQPPGSKLPTIMSPFPTHPAWGLGHHESCTKNCPQAHPLRPWFCPLPTQEYEKHLSRPSEGHLFIPVMIILNFPPFLFLFH